MSDMPKTEAGWPVVGMTLEEAAQALRVTKRTMFTLIKDRGLPARRVGKGWRIDPDALRRWISTRDEQPVDAGDGEEDGETCI